MAPGEETGGALRMTAGRRRPWGSTVLLLAILAGPAWGEGDPTTFDDRIVAVVRSAEPPAEIAVIRVYHADAEDLAATLRRVLPPGVTVVADVPTNSLVVSLPLLPAVDQAESE